MKTPTEITVDSWIDSIQKQGYRRIKLRALLKAFGAKRRGTALMDRIDVFLKTATLCGRPFPLAVEWERAEDLDEPVRIVPLSVSPELVSSHIVALESKPLPASSKIAAVPKLNTEKQPDAGTILRAISIRQPYVEAILQGKKTIEYRSRKTNIRERVYLYASNSPGEPCYGLTAKGLPTGAIVGTVEIVNCTGVEGDYEIHLANPKRLDKHLKAKNQPQPMFWRPQF